ncbi:MULTISPECIES: VOC family protein [Protofrankia]|uniref:Glyoxalase/bleomycin resistance protein/dioxygenase n=1 Tax=Candidatus Protofrankia californiensis TaxID=1839754 RepID=A0A1C3P8Q8_9ACTN|nr:MULTISPECIES: VOC family protein [Protofrankia]SBW26048.1 glyoxalase/bleomycin resistance protein/dioxygenase [Candidatus Protofrankia californiensis]
MRNHAPVAWFETNGIRMARVGLDCVDVDLMVRFWSSALGYEVAQHDSDSAVLRHPAGAGPKLHLRRVSGLAPGPGRVHLDLYAVDAERVVGWLSSLGAREVGRYADGVDSGFVLADPEGNEFRVTTAGQDGFARPFA